LLVSKSKKELGSFWGKHELFKNDNFCYRMNF
jgi:hypothetical protein